MRKPSILVVTRNLPPLVGGMERLLWHVIDALRQEYAVIVVGPKGCEQYLPQDVRVFECPAKQLWLFLPVATIRALWAACWFRPRIVFAGSGLVAPVVWIVSRIRLSRCVVYLHGLDISAPHPLYQWLWLPCLRRFNLCIVNSCYTKQLAERAGMSPQRIHIVPPGVLLPALDDAVKRSCAFRKLHNLGEGHLLLFVGRITKRKGLVHFVSYILPHIVAEFPEVRLLVIGSPPIHALYGEKDERQRVIDLLSSNGLEKNVIFLGHCSDEELHNAYFASNVFVFPVQESITDIEGFGMVALEAAAHGLPTVAFAVGGVPDAVSDGNSGKLIAPGDNRAFSHSVVEFLHFQSDIHDQFGCCREFAADFAWSKFNDRLCRLLNTYTEAGWEQSEPNRDR